MINIEHLSKQFHQANTTVDALVDVSLHVEEGDIFGVIGFSGAGKSTLIRMVNRLEIPDSGTITVNGTSLATLSKKELLLLRKKIGMVFQQFNLLEGKTVYQNIALPLQLDGQSKTAIREKVTKLLSFVELEDKADSYVNKLSGGQKQRVGIARALATDPSILLCDEATSALDPKTTESILTLLKRINREMGVTILLITHQMQVIQRICNKVAVMENGRVIEQGSVLNVFGLPQEETTKNFVRTIINDTIPLPIRSLLAKDNENSHIERLNFIGETIHKPVIAQISSRPGIKANILCATVQEVQDNVICLFLLQISGEEAEIEAAEAYIDTTGVLRERVNL